MNTWILDTAIARLLSKNAVVLTEQPNAQMVGNPEVILRSVTLLERLSRRWQQTSKVSCLGGAYICPPHAGTAPSWRFGGYLFLRVFAFQYGVPGGAIGRHFELKVVGRGRKHLNGESSFYGL